MTVLDKILEQLNSLDVSYKRIDHEAVYTSEEAAKTRGADLSLGAKSIICYADTAPIMVVLQGNKNINFKTFKKLFGIKDLRMATAAQVKEITGLEIGSIPPTGSVLGLKVYFDTSLTLNEDAFFNAGSHTTSIFMKMSDLVRMENPLLGDYAEAKQ